jgi:hypothetical protein
MPDTQTERHPDITSKYLEAAILDQVVAGTFTKPYAFVAVVAAPRGWALGVAVANERGYTPTAKTFDSEAEAREWAQGLNEHIGWSDDEVMRIVISTMGGMPYERKRA